MPARRNQRKPAPPEPTDPARADDDEVIDLDADDTSADTHDDDALDDDGIEEEPGAERRRITVKKNVDRRLDRYLQQRLKGISRNKLQQLIARGGVTVNDREPKPSTKIKAGDVIDIILPPRAVRTIEPEPIPIHVIHEDDDVIVINKQAGIIVHPARSNLSGTLINGLAWRFKEQKEAKGEAWKKRTTRGFMKHDDRRAAREEDAAHGDVDGLSAVGAEEFRPGIVHRLDRNTTGVIVVAKRDESHWAIARQFENRTTLKAYLALVHGNFDTPGGVIEEPIGKHPTIREAHGIRRDSMGKHAVTLYRVREQYAGYSLVELELKTGRTHQIRVHLSYLGFPIVGDIIYGGEPLGEAEIDNPPTPAASRRMMTFARDKAEGQRVEQAAAARDDILIAHPALHATLLQFLHPATHKRETYTASLHEPFLTVVHRLREKRIDAPVADEGYFVDLSQAVPPKG